MVTEATRLKPHPHRLSRSLESLDNIIVQLKDIMSSVHADTIGLRSGYYRKKCLLCSKILDSLMAWLSENRKTEFS